MAVMQKNKNIIIALDPGFDSLKVTTNDKTMFKISKEVVDVTNKSFPALRNDDYIEARVLEGKTHLVGNCAARLINETQGEGGRDAKVVVSDTFASFETVEKEILIKTGIAKALIELAEKGNSVVSLKKIEDDEDGYPVREVVTTQADLYIGVALPHDVVQEQWGYVKSWLKGHHDYSIVMGGIKYNISIDVNKMFPQSQVVLALIGAISDDEGNIDLNSNSLTSANLPAIVIDGGYLTLGKFLFTSVQSVENGESNQKYAMKNVYDKVAEIIRSKYGRDEYTGRMVKIDVENNEEIPYLDKNGKPGRIDVSGLVKEQVQNICAEMVDNFNKEYNNLLRIKSILVTGGTGYIYFETIKELLKDRDWVKVILTDYEFNGKKISPEYAISVGLYKALYHQAERESK